MRKQPKPSVNPLKKLQLSILNNRYIPIDPNPDKAYRLLPKKAMDYNAFAKHMLLIRKYEVMLKMEFQVCLGSKRAKTTTHLMIFFRQAASRTETYTKHCTRHANKTNNELKNTYPKKSVPCE